MDDGEVAADSREELISKLRDLQSPLYNIVLEFKKNVKFYNDSMNESIEDCQSYLNENLNEYDDDEMRDFMENCKSYLNEYELKKLHDAKKTESINQV